MVAYATPHLRVVLSGKMGNGVAWNTTDVYSVLPGAVPSQATMQALVNALVGPYKTMWSGSVGLWSSTSTSFLQVAGYWYAANVSGAGAQATAPVVSASGSKTPGAPYSTAAVVTKLTGNTSKSGRGRNYWPADAVETGGIFNLTDLTNGLGVMGNMYDAFKAAPPAPLTQMTLALLSPKLTTVFDVKALRVDTRPDRIEHREHGVVYANYSRVLA